MDLNIQYGLDGKTIDVTHICLTQLMRGSIIYIPANDGDRSRIFSDPLVGFIKPLHF